VKIKPVSHHTLLTKHATTGFVSPRITRTVESRAGTRAGLRQRQCLGALALTASRIF
jgi:hypothetical protein